jgi:NDP-sugar pyrophosphorylase family protein
VSEHGFNGNGHNGNGHNGNGHNGNGHNGNGHAATVEAVEALVRKAAGSANGRNGGTKAVVLAGGRGTRLAPYTSVLPKPLMPVGERAILELVVEQLEACAITDITFCVGYLAHLIQAVFDNRENGHVDISYVHEHEALGTAGPLRLVPDLDTTFVVLNGDVLTDLNYAELVAHHRENGNAVTIATRDRPIKIDYGVLHLDGHIAPSGRRIIGYEEKPELVSTVSMGIYVLEPWVLEHIPAGRHFDVPDLVQALLAAGEQVGAYRFEGLWFDIGRKEDYEHAVAAWERHENGYPAAAEEIERV